MSAVFSGLAAVYLHACNVVVGGPSPGGVAPTDAGDTDRGTTAPPDRGSVLADTGSPPENPCAGGACPRVIQLTAGDRYTCALLEDRSVRCWGTNSSGRLGDGTTVTRLRPTAVTGLMGVAQVAVGYEHTCAVKTDGTVWCWGSNFRGQLGTPAGEPQTVPRQVADLANIQQLAVAPGQNFSCALDGAGIPWCWGSNESGQLGRGTMETVGRAASVAIGDWRLTLLRAGGLRACGVPRNNPRALVCWGWSDRGTFGPAVMTSMAVRSPMLITLDVPIDP